MKITTRQFHVSALNSRFFKATISTINSLMKRYLLSARGEMEGYVIEVSVDFEMFRLFSWFAVFFVNFFTCYKLLYVELKVW